jgi:hypothetical protein
MALTKFRSELLAYESFTRLLRQAEECADAFRQASIDVPSALKRLLAEESEDDEPRELQLSLIPPVRREHTPPEADKDWISISVSDCTPTSVTLAVLREAGRPMRAREVSERVLQHLPGATYGSIANLATRLAGSQIQRADEGWTLLKPELAPILNGGYLWGLPSIFSKQEIAAHRREALCMVLQAFPSGLQIVQIVDQLKSLGWVQAPINKDLLKEDVAVLSAQGKINKRGNSGKWELRKGDRD